MLNQVSEEEQRNRRIADMRAENMRVLQTERDIATARAMQHPQSEFEMQRREAEEKEKKRIEELKRQSDIVFEERKVKYLKWKSEQYLKWYGEWTPELRQEFVDDWKKKNITSREDVYKLLVNHMTPMWTGILNCIEAAPINPNDNSISKFDKDLFYDHIVPECGMLYEWYMTPGVNRGNWLKGEGWESFSKFERSSFSQRSKMAAKEVSDYIMPIVAAAGFIALAILIK